MTILFVLVLSHGQLKEGLSPDEITKSLCREQGLQDAKPVMVQINSII